MQNGDRRLPNTSLEGSSKPLFCVCVCVFAFISCMPAECKKKDPNGAHISTKADFCV